jgi:hypothetical protein
MQYQFEMLRQGRKNMLALLEPYSLEQLNRISTGFKNNLIWNFGHVIVSHQILCYKFSGLPAAIPESIIDQFKKGTIPAKPVSEKELEELKAIAVETVEIFQRDYKMGIFKKYQGYQSHYGVRINSIEDAIVFNNTHEGLHLGYVMAMRKLID